MQTTKKSFTEIKPSTTKTRCYWILPVFLHEIKLMVTLFMTKGMNQKSDHETKKNILDPKCD